MIMQGNHLLASHGYKPSVSGNADFPQNITAPYQSIVCRMQFKWKSW